MVPIKIKLTKKSRVCFRVSSWTSLTSVIVVMAIFYKQSMILELLLNKTAMTSVFYTQSSKS